MNSRMPAVGRFLPDDLHDTRRSPRAFSGRDYPIAVTRKISAVKFGSFEQNGRIGAANRSLIGWRRLIGRTVSVEKSPKAKVYPRVYLDGNLNTRK